MSYEDVVKFIRGMGGYTNARTELRRMLGEKEGTGVTTEIANLTQGALIARLTADESSGQGETDANVYDGGRGLGDNSATPDVGSTDTSEAEHHGDGGTVEGGEAGAQATPGAGADAASADGGGDGGEDGGAPGSEPFQCELDLDGGGSDGGDDSCESGCEDVGTTGRTNGDGEQLHGEASGDDETRSDAELERLERLLEEAQSEQQAAAEAAQEAARQAEARAEALAEARRKAEERRRAEEEARRKAEEEARKKAEAERRKAEREARRKAEEEARQKAERERLEREEAARRIPQEAHSSTGELVETLKTTGLAFLVGPAGTGKTTLAMGACEVIFGVQRGTDEFNEKYAQISFSPDTTAGEMVGRADVNGGFTESEIVRVFRDGGLILFDEIDNADASMLVKLNTAIANGYIATPAGLVRRNENTVIVCTGNTFGTGADAMYVGRARLDAATLDRFTLCTIFVDYDVKLEKRIAAGLDGDNRKWLAAFVKQVRSCIAKNRFRRICSTRFVVNGVKWLSSGKSRKWVAEKFLLPWKENEREAVKAVCIGDASFDQVAAAS